MKNIKAVIFDFDGTITDSAGLWNNKINVEYFPLLNINYEPDGEFSKKINGLNCSEITKVINSIKGSNYTDSYIRESWLDTSKKYFKEVILKPGVAELIKTLYKSNYRLAVASCNFKKLIEDYLNENGLLQYFKLIIGEQDVSRLKPEPEAYLKVCNCFNILPDECLVFEDSLSGVIAAKNAGMNVIAVYDEHSEQNIGKIKEKSDKFIYKYDELKNITDTNLAV